MVSIEFCNYDGINTKVEEFFNSDLDCECHITDISINNELAKKINKGNKKYQLLDHHPTALELNEYDWCGVVIEDEKTHIKTSGTELYYKWMVNNNHLKKTDTLDRFVETVRNYDTWRWVSLGEDGVICKQVNDLLYLYGREEFIEWSHFRILSDTFPKLSESDKLILSVKQKEIDDYIKEKDKQLFTRDLCGKVCGFVFAEKYFSELGNKLCQMHPEIDFIAMISMNGTVSYRTIKDDIDLGKDVAKLFGGGGHPKAAGSKFAKDVQLKVIKEIFK